MVLTPVEILEVIKCLYCMVRCILLYDSGIYYLFFSVGLLYFLCSKL